MPLSRNGIKTMIGRGEPKIGRAEREVREKAIPIGWGGKEGGI
jgi:hypothetical protein